MINSYDWDKMALEQCRQANFSGAPYHRSLVNAARFGPWKDDIQLIITERALHTWDDLNPAAVALLIHSIVDFNLPIPANTATFMVILALGWISRFGGRINWFYVLPAGLEGIS